MLNLRIRKKGKIAAGCNVVVAQKPLGGWPLHDPREGLIRFPSGSDANPLVVASAAGLPVRFATAFVRSPLGIFLERELRKFAFELIYKDMTEAWRADPINGPDIALVDTDSGSGGIAPVAYYHRANEAQKFLAPGAFDLDTLLDGVTWFHSGGIFAVLGHRTADLILEIFEAANARGIITSFDLNFRQRFVNALPDQKAWREKMRRILNLTDVALGNEEDWQKTFGLAGPEIEGVDELDPSAFKGMISDVVLKEFPNLKLVGTTMRHVINAGLHRWKGLLWHDGAFFESPTMDIPVVDRVGGGDGFAGGLITATILGYEAQAVVDHAWAAGAAVALYRCDMFPGTWENIQDLAAGKAARVLR